MYNILKDIIYDKAQLKNYNSEENSFYIKENSQAECNRIDLLKFESEDNTFGFELDCKMIKYKGIHKISPYFENGKGFDKGNDAIILTSIANQQYIFICELKDGAKGFISQFKSSRVFIDYLKSILKVYYDIKMNTLNIKFIVFSKKGSLNTNVKGKFYVSKQDGIEFYHLPCSRKHYYITSFI
ncbi:MAG: hypothetical protein QM493_07710 [Sulfurovum sp.]